uniref:Uncharacterized protein n=1 Tax=Opuntia streptacantha TaxID=393608 RepID=A0A7C8Z4E0_OPUST
MALLESFDARPIRCLLASLLLLPPTLSKTTLMEIMKKGGWNGVYWVSSKCLDTSYYKGKKPEKCAGKQRGTKKTAESQAAQARTAVRLPPQAVAGSTVSPWWALSLQVRLLLQRCVLCSFGASIWVVDFVHVGSF